MNAANKNPANNANNSSAEVEVLYQKIGSRWYAFSLVNNEVFLGSLSEEELAQAKETGLESFIEMPLGQNNGEYEIA